MKNILSFSKTKELNKIYLGMHLLEKVGKRVLPIKVRNKLIGMIGRRYKVIFFLLVQVLLVLSVQFPLSSQTTFNIKYKIMHHINDPGPVAIYKDTIICLGHGVDHDGFDYYASFMAKFDLEGNYINRSVDTLGSGNF